MIAVNNHIMVEADKMFFTADQKISEGNISDAADLLFKVIESYPEYGRAYNHLGYLYENMFKDTVTAEKYYKEALSKAPEFAATYLNYAVILSSQERFAELNAILNKSLEVPGIQKDKVYNEFGIMFEIQGKYNDAINSFKKAVNYSLNENEIELYEKSINRCQHKIRINKRD